MKKMICILLAAMLLTMTAGALAQESGMTKITVQGSGVVHAVPDMVTVTVNASMMAGTMLDAQTKVSAIVESATTKLTELGVKGSDIVTTNYGYNPQYSYETDVRRLIGYQASHTLEITCRDVMMLDAVIGVVTDCGMSDIYNVSYDVSNRGELYMQALDLAIRSAEEKALSMAAASSKMLTGLDSLSENMSYDARFALKSAEADEAAGMNTGIRAGGVSVSASVTAVYCAQ